MDKVFANLAILDKEGPEAALTAAGENKLLQAYAYLGKGDVESADKAAAAALSGGADKGAAQLACAEVAIAKGSSSAESAAEQARKLLDSDKVGKPSALLALAKAKLLKFASAGIEEEEKALLMMNKGIASGIEIEKLAKEAVQLCKTGGDKTREAYALQTLANVYVSLQDSLTAMKTAEEAMSIFRASGNQRGEALTQKTMAYVQILRSPDAKDPVSSALEASALFTAVNDLSGKASSLLTAADAYYMSGQLSKMSDAATQALDLYKELKSKKGESSALQTICAAQIAKLNGEEASDAGEKAMSLVYAMGDDAAKSAVIEGVVKANFKKLSFVDTKEGIDEVVAFLQKKDDKAMVAKTYCLAAEGCLAMAGLGQCEKYVELALSEYKSLNDVDGQCKAKKVMLKLYAAKKDSDKELKLADEIVQMYKSAGNKKGEALALTVVAGINCKMERPTDAIKKAKEAAAAFKSAGDTLLEKMSLLQVIEALKATDVDQALNAASEAKAYYESQKDTAGMVAMMKVMCEIDMMLGLYDEAVKVSKEAVSTSKEADLVVGLAKAQASMENWEDAAKSAKDAIEIYKKDNNKVGEVDALCLLSSFLWSDDMEESLKTAKEALETAKASGSKSAEGSASKALAEVYMTKEMGKEALAAANNAIALFKDACDQDGEASALCVVANLKFTTGDFAEAKHAANEAAGLFKVLGNLSGAGNAQEILSSCYRVSGEVSEAVTAMTQALSLFTAAGDQTSADRANALLTGLPGSAFTPVPTKSQATETKISKFELDEVTYSRQAPNFPRFTSTDKAKSAVINMPHNAFIWAKDMSDTAPTCNNSDYLLFCTAMSKSAVNLPILVMSRGAVSRNVGQFVPTTIEQANCWGLYGLIRTSKQELPQIPQILCDIDPQYNAAEIGKCLRPAEPEAYYYNISGYNAKFSQKLEQVNSYYRRDRSGNFDQPYGGKMYQEKQSASKFKPQRFSRKAFKWGVAGTRLDNAWYRAVAVLVPSPGMADYEPLIVSGWQHPLNTFR